MSNWIMMIINSILQYISRILVTHFNDFTILLFLFLLEIIMDLTKHGQTLPDCNFHYFIVCWNINDFPKKGNCNLMALKQHMNMCSLASYSKQAFHNVCMQDTV